MALSRGCPGEKRTGDIRSCNLHRCTCSCTSQSSLDEHHDGHANQLLRYTGAGVNANRGAQTIQQQFRAGANSKDRPRCLTTGKPPLTDSKNLIAHWQPLTWHHSVDRRIPLLFFHAHRVAVRFRNSALCSSLVNGALNPRANRGACAISDSTELYFCTLYFVVPCDQTMIIECYTGLLCMMTQAHCTASAMHASGA